MGEAASAHFLSVAAPYYAVLTNGDLYGAEVRSPYVSDVSMGSRYGVLYRPAVPGGTPFRNLHLVRPATNKV